MTRRASYVLLLGLLAACASESQNGPKTLKVGDAVDINNDGELDGVAIDTDGDGIPDSVDLDGDGTPDGLLPGFGPKPGNGATPDGGEPGDDGEWPTGDGDGDSQGGDGDNGEEDPPLVIELPTAKVPCGDSICEGSNNKVCCQSWKRAGFGSKSSCIPEGECARATLDSMALYYTAEAPLLGINDPDRAVVSRCDGTEDCAASQVCCYVRLGMPVGFPPNWTGPGAGRQCMPVEDCSNTAAASGLPTGVLACNDEIDCRKAPGTKCLPEQDNSATTGANVKARAGFLVCR